MFKTRRNFHLSIRLIYLVDMSCYCDLLLKTLQKLCQSKISDGTLTQNTERENLVIGTIPNTQSYAFIQPCHKQLKLLVLLSVCLVFSSSFTKTSSLF